MIPLGCVTGRFQPIHQQHLGLFDIALEACTHLIIAVTNPDTGARHREPGSAHRRTASANPFSYFERARLITAALREHGVAEHCTLVPFDLARNNIWPQYVPSNARHFVRAYGEWEREKARRLEHAGYAVTLLEGNAANRVSASEIRASLRAGDGAWQALVPAATRPVLEQMMVELPMGARS